MRNFGPPARQGRQHDVFLNPRCQDSTKSAGSHPRLHWHFSRWLLYKFFTRRHLGKKRPANSSRSLLGILFATESSHPDLRLFFPARVTPRAVFRPAKLHSSNGLP